jgi:Ca2+-binding EF-hand superfamily protein
LTELILHFVLLLIYSGLDFLSVLNSKVQDEASDVEISQAFVVFDRDKTGFITSGDLYSVMEILGQKVNKEQLSAIFKEADLDGDGVINCMCSLPSSISQQH